MVVICMECDGMIECLHSNSWSCKCHIQVIVIFWWPWSLFYLQVNVTFSDHGHYFISRSMWHLVTMVIIFISRSLWHFGDHAWWLFYIQVIVTFRWQCMAIILFPCNCDILVTMHGDYFIFWSLWHFGDHAWWLFISRSLRHFSDNGDYFISGSLWHFVDHSD